MNDVLWSKINEFDVPAKIKKMEQKIKKNIFASCFLSLKESTENHHS
jgi:hypothetical protein